MKNLNTPVEVWAGLECTINRVGDVWFNQNKQNGHARRMEDLDLFAGLGVRRIRYPILWETAQPSGQGPYDFSWAEPRIARLRELGVEVIAGLLHHGSGPQGTSLVDPEFPEKLASYARAVAEKFPHLNYYTPVNEPLTTARFSGLYGHWYPHGKDNATFLRALMNEVKGTVLAMREIRKVNPGAQLIQTDDLGRAQGTPPMQEEVDFQNERRWLGYDLLFGMVNPDHKLWPFMLENGVAEEELVWLVNNPCPPEVVGVNHYPLSNRYLDHRAELYPPEFHCVEGQIPHGDLGAPQARALYPNEELPVFIPPEEVIREACLRYGRPVAVTEVHISGNREAQLQWISEVWHAACRLKAEGHNVCAITIWSLLGAFDWHCLCTACRSFYEPGVFDVRSPEPRPTAIAKMTRSLATQGEFPHPLAHKPGWWRRRERGLTRNPPILIAGAGKLGSAFARIAYSRGIDYSLVNRSQADIASAEEIRRALDSTRPMAVINAAGFARVNQAEQLSDRAYRENVLGGEVLARECERRGIPLVSFSSHLVFDGSRGEQPTPYLEHEEARPLNTYGQTKLEMEKRVLNIHPGAMVVRTSTFFSPWDDENVVMKILHAARRGEGIILPEDFVVSPTYVPDLVNSCLDLLLDGMTGVVHLSNSGEVSWAELARSTLGLMGLNREIVQGQSSEALGYVAKRPAYSALASSRTRLMPPIEEALERMRRELTKELSFA